VKAICATIETVTPANDYAHDMSKYTDSAGRPSDRVFRGRTIFGENDPLPAVAVLEDPRSLDANNGTGNSTAAANEFRLLIQGFVRDDKDHPLDPAYMLSAEIIKALVGAKKERFNILGMGSRAPCVSSLSIGQPIHRPADDEISSQAYFLIPIRLMLAENLETPFA